MLPWTGLLLVEWIFDINILVINIGHLCKKSKGCSKRMKEYGICAILGFDLGWEIRRPPAALRQRSPYSEIFMYTCTGIWN